MWGGQYQFQLVVLELMLSTPRDVKATGVQVIGTRTSGSGANPQRPRLVPGRCLVPTSGQPAEGVENTFGALVLNLCCISLKNRKTHFHLDMCNGTPLQ